MALVPEHNLPALVHAHHMAPREAPGHSIDSSTEEKEGQVLGQGGGSVGGEGSARMGLQPGSAPHYWTWKARGAFLNPFPYLLNGLPGLW
jgi:hypothetical protein